MNHRLNMFEPITLPTDNEPLQFIAAIPERNNSGADVHIANMVNQMNKSDTLKCFAILTLVLIRWFDEKTSKYKPTINTITARSIFLFYNKSSCLV